VSRFNAFQRAMARVLAAMMVVVGLMSATAQAAMVTTGDMVVTKSLEQTRNQVMSILDQKEAQDTLVKLGVSRADVEERINSMTADELQAFSKQVEDMQAGGSVLGIILTIILILLILDLLGATNVFPAIKPINSGK